MIVMFGRLNHIIWLVALALPLFVCCSEDNPETVGSGNAAALVFRARLDTGIESRAISDGTAADRLLVAVYEGETTLTETFRREYALSDAMTDGIELRLLSGHDYKVLFWAYDADNAAYTISNQGVITTDYTGYLDGGFAKAEQLDAFYAVSSVSVSGSAAKDITLIRPFAQLNFADNATQPTAGAHYAEITFDNLATSFNPFSGTGSGETGPVTFTFADFTSETLESDGSTYYYVATHYLFVPESGSVSAICRLKQAGSGTVITEHTIPAISVSANKRTNVLGTIVSTPEDLWDGITLTVPGVDSENRYIIDEASDLAWLAQNGSTLEQNRTFVVTKDLNMNKRALGPVRLPQGSSIEGGDHTFKNIATNGSGLFGSVTDFAVSSLTVDNITSNGTSGHIGALVDTLYGNGSFTSVSVKNAVVSTGNGAAGGMVGYAVRKSEKARSETMTLTFSDCHIESTSVSGSASEGVFVGLLSGYDDKETVSFATNCSASAVTIADYKSPYAEGNEGAWLADNDYSRYNGWLGDETYCRGTVNYGGTRFIPRWDGAKKVEPLVESGAKVIHSAFDLAYLQGGSHAAVTFKENVDLGGVKSPDPKDDTKGVNRFVSISSITNLDGGNHTLYGLYIHVVNCQYWVGGGFLLGISGATTHKNLTFDGAQIIVTHNYSDDDGGARAGTLLPTVENGSYVAENIHARNGYVYGVNKMGGLFGYVAASQFNVSNCSVTGYSIENYNSGKKDSFGFLANGEVGGMIGFLQANSEIKNCNVTNTAFNCLGVDNGPAEGLYALLGTIAGRHVNGFIGDIRTPSAQVIKLSNCTTNGNTFSNRTEDKYSHTYTYYTKNGQVSDSYKWGWTKVTDTADVDIAGCCYYIDFGYMITDQCGKLFVDGVEKKICNKKP